MTGSAPPVWTAEDRSLAVRPDQRVVTAWVPIDQVVLGCRERMAVGDVERAYRRLLCLGDSDAFPPPVGYWQGTRFVLTDGRHSYIASLMLGRERLLVAWLEE